MQELPDVAMFISSKSSPYAPGDVVRVSNEVTKFALSIKGDVQEFAQLVTPPESLAESLTETSPISLPHFGSLLEPGKVVEVNSDGDVIVEFTDGRVWCIRSCFLQHGDWLDESAEGAETSSSEKVSEGVDRLIEHAFGLGRLELTLRIHATCFSGNKKLLEQLLAANNDPECEDVNGNKPLHYAAYGNQPEIIKLLLSHKAKINAVNTNCHTALQFAVKLGFVNCVRELTQHHEAPNPNIQDNSGNTALHVAVANRNAEIINELIKLPEVDFTVTNKYGLNVLHVAALRGNTDAVEMIMSKQDALVNHKQEDEGYAALHLAAVSGHYSVVETLLMQDSCVVDLMDKYEETALLLAAREGHWDIVELLFQAGAYINKADRHGNTALHLSLMKVNEPLAKCLDMPTSRAMQAVEKKIGQHDPDSANGRLRLPCFLARSGADIDCRNKNGQTPFETAPSLNQSAKSLLEFFHNEWQNRDSKKCQVCLEATANAPFNPCGHCVCCGDCGVRMKRCCQCGTSIAGRVVSVPRSTFKQKIKEIEVTQAGTPMVQPQSTTNTGNTSLQSSAPQLNSSAELEQTSVPTVSTNTAPSPCPEGTSEPADLETLNNVCPSKLQVHRAEVLKTGERIYKMTRNPRGRCIILNNAHFDGCSDLREGSELDVYRMEALFTQLHFKVTVGSNLSAIEMKHLLRDVSKAETQKNADCLVVILMSHGKEGVICGTDNEELHLESDVFQTFNNENCPALQGKPKIFFIQACRGGVWDNGTKDVRETSDNPQARNSGQPDKRIPSRSDMYIAYATIPGYVALRNAQTGPWFLSAVSEVFSKHACSTCLDGLMRAVHEKVMECSAHDGSKQTPRICSDGWTKKLYFNPGLWAQ